MNLIKHIIASALLLLLALVLFETTDLDVQLNNLLFDFSTDRWMIDKNDAILRFIFYDAVKVVLISFEIFLLVTVFFFRKNNWVNANKNGLVIVSISLLVVPAVVATLKTISNVACPNDLIVYGARLPYIHIFDAYPDAFASIKHQRCFPAAHASGGFSLLSLYFLANNRQQRIYAATFALSLGWLMGGYKMLIGDHFLSHTVISMVLAWLIVNIIAFLVTWITDRKSKVWQSRKLSAQNSVYESTVYSPVRN